jgi:hypothetical protein
LADFVSNLDNINETEFITQLNSSIASSLEYEGLYTEEFAEFRDNANSSNPIANVFNPNEENQEINKHKIPRFWAW